MFNEDMTNEQRAERGRRALDCYQGDDDFVTSAVDLIADLCHMFDLQTGTHPNDALESALMHYTAEKVEIAT